MTADQLDLAPGIYPSRDGNPAISAVEYHSLPYASKSRLWSLTKSPAYCKARMEDPETTAALAFGTAFDEAVFDEGMPPLVSDFATDCKGHRAFCDENPGRVCLTKNDAANLRPMQRSLKRHPFASEIFYGTKGVNQATVIWDDAETGVRCKARIDRFCGWTWPQGDHPVSSHFDLKTARSADLFKFNRDANEFGYGLQVAHYRNGCETLDKTLFGRTDPLYRRFGFVVVEKKPEYHTPDLGPVHRVEVMEYQEQDIGDMMRLRRELLNIWKGCIESGQWPDREPRIGLLDISERWKHL